MATVVSVAFSNLVAVFHSCLASHPLLICLGHSVSETRWAQPYRVGGNPRICGVFFGVAPAPFCVVSLFSLLAKRKSGREICVSSLLPCFFLLCLLLFPWFASFVKPKGFILFAHFSTASLTVRTEP